MKRAVPLLMILAACDPAGAPPITNVEDPPARIPTGSGQRYDCDTGATFFANNGATGALVTLDTGEALQLPRVGSSAGGTQYAANGVVWFVQGSRAVLTERGGQINCRVAGGF